MRLILLTALVYLTSACTQLPSGNPPSAPAELSPKQIIISTSTPTINEGDVISFQVTLDKPATSSMSLIWQVLDASTRFKNTTGTITVNSGSASATLDLQSLQNNMYDGDSSITLQIQDQGNTLPMAAIKFQLRDKDPQPFLKISDEVAVKGSKFSFHATLSNPASHDVHFSWSTADASAKAGSDYMAAKGDSKFPAGTTDVVISVTSLPAPWPINEKSRTFTVNLTNVDVVIVADGTATGTIMAGDATIPTVTFMSGGDSVQESAGVYNIPVQLSNALPVDVTIYFKITGSAAINSRYKIDGASLVIPAGQTSANYKVTLIDDTIFEVNEDVLITMNSSVNAGIGAIGAFDLTITDNDKMPNISVSDTQANEGDDLVFAISLDSVSGADTVVNFKTSNGTATESRYTPAVGSLTIPKGTSVANVKIHTTHDGIFSDRGTMSLVLVSVVNATISRGSATGTIVDIDPMPSVQFSSASQNIPATQKDVTVTVTLSQLAGIDVLVPYTVGGSAVPGTDHNLTESSIKIPAGQKSGSVVFQVFRHSPPTRTVHLGMKTPTNASIGNQSVQDISF